MNRIAIAAAAALTFAGCASYSTQQIIAMDCAALHDAAGGAKRKNAGETTLIAGATVGIALTLGPLASLAMVPASALLDDNGSGKIAVAQGIKQCVGPVEYQDVRLTK